MILNHDDLALEPIHESDIPELFALTDDNRSYLREWLPWVDLNTQEADTRNFVHHSRGQKQAGTGITWTIRSANQLVGMIDYHKIDREEGKAEIGYWLAKSQQGQGIVTRACSMIIEYGKQKLGLRQIGILCIVENLKSKAIPERLGFRKVKTVKSGMSLYGQKVDLDVYILEMN